MHPINYIDVKAAQATPVPYQTPVQNVIITQHENTLNLQYQQKVTLIVDAGVYKNLWGASFEQDFSQSALAGMDYTTATIEGNETLNWVSTNLNDVQKSTRDTVISGIQMVEIHFERTFNFFKTYASNSVAATQLQLIKQQPGRLLFTTYYSSGDDDTKQNTYSADLKAISP